MDSERENRQPQNEPMAESAFAAKLPTALQQVADSLSALVPAASRVDRDRLMYEAGRAAVVNSQAPGQPSRARTRVFDICERVTTAADLRLAVRRKAIPVGRR